MKLLNTFDEVSKSAENKCRKQSPLSLQRIFDEYESNWDRIIQPKWAYDHIGLFFYIRHRFEAYRDKIVPYYTDVNSSETTVVKGNGLRSKRDFEKCYSQIVNNLTLV